MTVASFAGTAVAANVAATVVSIRVVKRVVSVRFGAVEVQDDLSAGAGGPPATHVWVGSLGAG